MRPLLRCYAPYLLILLLVAAACARCGIAPYMLMREPQNLGGLPWYAGGFSILTGWLWCATAVVCCFVWSILGERSDADGLPKFMLYFGMLTIALMFDDAFQFHEHADEWFGVGEKVVYAGYLGMLLVGLGLYRHEIRKSELRLLASALACLGLSIVVDVFQGRFDALAGPWRILFEDGFKLLGAAGWLGYFTTTGSRALRLPFAAAPARPAYAETGSSRIGRSTTSLTEAQQRSQ